MRFCITVFALIGLAFPSWSIDNEGLYKTCAPYADRGFNAEEIEDLTCISYILATIDHARNVCNFANTVRKYKRNDDKHAAKWMVPVSLPIPLARPQPMMIRMPSSRVF